MPTALQWDFPRRIVTANQVLDGFKMAGFQRCSLRREEFLLQGYGLETTHAPRLIGQWILEVITKGAVIL
jgi:hypothetical protein